MTVQTPPARSWALIVVMSIVIVFTAAFMFMMFNWQSPGSATGVDEPPLAEQVAAIMPNADPVRGEQHMTTYACAACHVAGAANHVAPPFTGADVAATRRPPLTAEEYLYEAIVNPGAYIVEGYPNSMPQDYRTRISPQEIGDMIAYLLTLPSSLEATPEATPDS